MIAGMIREMFGDFRPGPATRTITVAKPYCAPARDIVMTALQPYGVKVFGYKERTDFAELRGFLRRMKIEVRTWENLQYGPAAPGFLPMACVADVTISEKQAAWAEYLMLRTGKLYVPGEYVNKRNADWAARHGGQMPTAWKDGQPWIEKSCSEGKAAWGPIRNAMKKGKR